MFSRNFVTLILTLSLHNAIVVVGASATEVFTGTATRTGRSVDVTVVDSCPTCGDANDLDLTTGAFTAIDSLDAGQTPITWSFI
ncbi:hypothetical protein PM082_018468 [Marasmius tenuissimus]|nr:hypothetical protein PM082_018468 [Marasmius tenuissimus]